MSSDGDYMDSYDSYDGDTIEVPDDSEELMTDEAENSGEKELMEQTSESGEEDLLDEKPDDVEELSENVEATDANDSESVRAEIQEKSEYSDEVNDHIGSVEELEVYQDAGLKEENVDGRCCLVKDDIDLDYVDEESGLSNRELMERGRAPFDAKTGERIELHHIGQDYDSPLAELRADTDHGGANHSLLHQKESDSWRNDQKLNNHYNNVQRPSHWKARV